MRRGLWTAAAFAHALAGALAAGAPALAQDRTREQEVAEVAAELVGKFNVLGDALGIDAPLLPAEGLTEALVAALPTLPEGDGRDWSSSFGFDFKTDRTTAGLEADEDGRVVLTDARSCREQDQPDAEIVHFERFTRGEVRGHRCILSFAGSDGETWVLASRTFAEGPNRRLSALYAVATDVDGDRDTARRLLEARLDPNVALAGVLADYALEMFLLKEASSDPLTLENFAERAARLQARMGEIAQDLESAEAAR